MLVLFVLVILTIPLSAWAAWRVRSTFGKYAKVGTRSGLSGADVARMLLSARGLEEVRVEKTAGYLTDHYDPQQRVLRLSEATHDSRSVAAIGVAAHEAGHALQHADGYSPLTFRSAVVPVVALGSRMLPILVLLAIFTAAFRTGGLIAWLVVAALALIAIFSLITLPVEYNASSRALAVLENGGILAVDELPAARSVLNAAALTYVAAAVSAVVQLAYYGVMLLGGGSND